MDDEDKPKSFEETLRAIADEVQRGIQRVQQGDLEDIARSLRRRRRSREALHRRRRRVAARAGRQPRRRAVPGRPRPRRRRRGRTRCAAPGPDPLDVPTDEQGRALAALDSGRWTVEPGTSALSSHGDGPGPSDALGLVRELRVRDWIDADGEVTLVGRHALQPLARDHGLSGPGRRRPVARRTRSAASGPSCPS